MKRLLLALVAVAMIGFFTTQVNAQGYYQGRGPGGHHHHHHRSYYQPAPRYGNFNYYYGQRYLGPSYYRGYSRSYYSPGYCSPYSGYRGNSGFSLYLGF